MKVVTGREMREIEQLCAGSGISLSSLMERAGRMLAAEVVNSASGGAISVLVGPGNNGGDGLVCAEMLRSDGFDVTAYVFHRENLHPFSGSVIRAEDDQAQLLLRSLLDRSSVVVDALLGAGSFRPPEGMLLSIVETVNATNSRLTRVSADIPSGVNPDTGSAPGPAIRADVTVIFGTLKVGNVVHPGSELSGTLKVHDIGIPPSMFDGVKTRVPGDEDIAPLLPTRKRDSNKGSGGRLLLIGGSRDFHGAPGLSAAAAYRAGAGIVQVATIAGVQASVAAHVQEVIFTVLSEDNGTIAASEVAPVREALARANALAIGPGLGHTDASVAFATGVVRSLAEVASPPAIVDADALNALARTPHWWSGIGQNIVVTPHPGEMARLTERTISDIQSDRLGTAREFAERWGVVVVLKGSGTVVASPEGEAIINSTGGPNLATAGTGDVLSGIIGGLMAQGIHCFDAAVSGVYLHGRVGDMLRNEQGDIGTVASDLPPFIPSAYLSILQGATRQ